MDFLNDYERANPMTKKEGEIRYLETLEKKHKMNKKEIEKRKKRIKEENPMRFYRNQVNNKNVNGINDILINDNIINDFVIVKDDEKNEGDIEDLMSNNSRINNEIYNQHNSNVLMNQGNTSKTNFTNIKFSGDN